MIVPPVEFVLIPSLPSVAYDIITIPEPQFALVELGLVPPQPQPHHHITNAFTFAIKVIEILKLL